MLFRGADGRPRAIAPGRLPQHETAWAMTIHKAQGSEYDRVLLVLPEKEHSLCTRELIYTGITRARQSVAVAASPEILRAAIERPTIRASGLVERVSDTFLPQKAE